MFSLERVRAEEKGSSAESSAEPPPKKIERFFSYFFRYEIKRIV